MNNGDLIKKLSKEGSTKTLANPNIRLIFWLVPSMAWIVGSLYFSKYLIQLDTIVSFQFIAMILFVLWTAKWVLELCIPGKEDTYEVNVLIFPLALWIVSMGIHSFTEGFISNANYILSWHCLSGSLLIASGPTVLLYWLGVKAAPMKKQQVSALCMISGVGIGSLVSQLTCVLQESSHLLVSHYLPMLILGSVGYILGKRIFKW